MTTRYDIGEFRHLMDHPVLNARDEVDLGRRILSGHMAAAASSDAELSPGPCAELAEAVREGEAAQDVLVRHNVRLVVTVARSAARRGTHSLELADLVQEGVVGLMKAAGRWDHRLGFRFSTYAVPYIRGTVLRAIEDQDSVVRLPRAARDIRRRLATAEDDPAGGEELPDAGAVPVSEAAVLAPWRRPLLSLDQPLPGDGMTTLAEMVVAEADLVDPTDSVHRQARRGAVALALGELDSRERTVLLLRFGFEGSSPSTLEQVAQILGVSRERARRYELSGLARLRQSAALKSVSA